MHRRAASAIFSERRSRRGEPRRPTTWCARTDSKPRLEKVSHCRALTLICGLRPVWLRSADELLVIHVAEFRRRGGGSGAVRGAGGGVGGLNECSADVV